MRSIYGLSIDDLKQYFIEKGEKPYRSTQIYEWIYRHNIRSFDQMTNQKKEIIELLKQDFSLDLLEVVVHQVSEDKTEKFLFRLADGSLIESVLMNHNYGNSVCVTSQVGCNMGCMFCASGLFKKQRNLETAEMVSQIVTISNIIGKRISHVVVMGTGEPFDNYDNVLKFIKVINEPLGLEIGARHISVSTCGLVPKIYQYAKENLQSNLAISLHASNDKVRNLIMPISKVYPLDMLIKAIKDYIEQTNRRVTLEYILIDNLNDQKEHALELAKLIRGLNVYVNLIPYNEVIEKPYKRSSKENMNIFYDTLKKQGINVTLRMEFGSDIDAACGQLRSKKLRSS